MTVESEALPKTPNGWSLREDREGTNEAKRQQRAIEVIKPLIPPDAEERVKQSFKQWNQIIRDHVRNETGLKLTEGEGPNSIPVRIVHGFPVKFAHLISQYDDPVLWRIVVGQPRIGGIVDGLRYLLPHWSTLPL